LASRLAKKASYFSASAGSIVHEKPPGMPPLPPGDGDGG